MTTIRLLGCVIRKLNEVLAGQTQILANQGIILSNQRQLAQVQQLQGEKLADVQLMVEAIDKAVEEPELVGGMTMTITTP